MPSSLAPIALFAYKRPAHVERALRTVLANPEAQASPLYIFCDGPRADADKAEVDQTRRTIRAIAPRHAALIERTDNLGLAKSIIDGVSLLTEEHGRVIVVEDDLVLSPYALRYFNDALERYRDEERVMHVSGYMFPVEAELPEAFFYREATCWGWATWRRAWKKFDSDGARIRDYLRAHGMDHEFNVRGSMGFTQMLEQQIEGKINSWAIRWYGSMRIAGGLALHPRASLVSNVGFDGTGEHCSETSLFDVRISEQPVRSFPGVVEESEAAVNSMIAYRRKHWGADSRPSLAARARSLLRRLAGRR